MDSNASSDDSPHPSHGCSLQLELWELGVMGPHCTAKFHGSMDSLQSESYRGEVFTGAVSAADLPLHSTGNAHRQCRSGLAVPHKEPREMFLSLRSKSTQKSTAGSRGRSPVAVSADDVRWAAAGRPGEPVQELDDARKP